MTLHLAESFPNSEHPRTLVACPSPPASLLFDWVRSGLVWRIRQYMDTRAVGHRCMAQMNQFSWSSSSLVDEQVRGGLQPSTTERAAEQRRSCPPINLRIDRSTDRRTEGRP